MTLRNWIKLAFFRVRHRHIRFGKNVTVYMSDKFYGKGRIGNGTKFAQNVEVGEPDIGENCKFEAFTFIAPGTVIEDYVFIGPHASIQNDRYPDLLKSKWTPNPVRIKRAAVIGGSAVVLAGVTIGEKALVGAGSVVTKDVAPGSRVRGNPAREF